MKATGDSHLPLGYYAVYCPYCGSSDIIFKEKVPTKKRDLVQRYLCKHCGRKFRWGAFIRDKYGKDIVKKVLELSVEGFKFSVIAKKLGISKSTVLKILKKYVPYLLRYEKVASPKIGSNLQLDDMWGMLADNYSFIKLSEQRKIDGLLEDKKIWITNVMDTKTRYWLASVAGLENEVTVVVALIKAVKMINEPKAKINLVTDSSTIYPKICKLFPTFNHIFESKKINIAIINDIERLNRTAREIIRRERRFRSLESLQKTLELFRLYYNFIRPHTSLNRRTPAEAAGCKLLTGDKWLTAINIGFQDLIKSVIRRRKRQEKVHDTFLPEPVDRKLVDYFD